MAERPGMGHVPSDVHDDQAAAIGFTWTALLAAQADSRPHLEFLRRDSLRAGLG